MASNYGYDVVVNNDVDDDCFIAVHPLKGRCVNWLHFAIQV